MNRILLTLNCITAAVACGGEAIEHQPAASEESALRQAARPRDALPAARAPQRASSFQQFARHWTSPEQRVIPMSRRFLKNLHEADLRDYSCSAHHHSSSDSRPKSMAEKACSACTNAPAESRI